MSRRNSRILFIDGFAGPGEYDGGEEGSPIIALRAYLDHTARARMTNEIGFFFIEKETKRVAHLRGMIDRLRDDLPVNCRVEVEQGEFDGTMTNILNWLDEQARRLAPAFVMVDPFGVKGTPMRVLARILRNPRTELYISFMYDWIRRFHEAPKHYRAIDYAVAELEKRGRLTAELQQRARAARERLARFRAQKKLDEAEVAEAGGNVKKAARLRAEANAVLAQDWPRAFPGEAPPVSVPTVSAT